MWGITDMGIEEILKHTLALLGECHIMGRDAENFWAAIKNIKTCIDAIEKEKGENGRDHHDGQGKNG